MIFGGYQRFFWSLRKTSLISLSCSLSRSERLSSSSLAPDARRVSRNAPSLDFFISRRPSSKSISTAAPPSSNLTTSPYAMPEPKAYETSSPTPKLVFLDFFEATITDLLGGYFQ